jgi:hypothetical protein
MLGHRFRTSAAGALVAVALTLLACGGSNDAGGETTTTEPPDTSTTTLTPSTTLDPVQQAEADVRAAYDAYWAMSERLAGAPDPQDPEIAQRTTGSARDALITRLTDLLTTGHAVRFGDGNVHDIGDITIDDETARLRDCHVDDARQTDVSTGETTLEAIATVLLEVTLANEGGSWKVKQLAEIDAWQGAVACE